jgi:hypothetical protein
MTLINRFWYNEIPGLLVTTSDKWLTTTGKNHCISAGKTLYIC